MDKLLIICGPTATGKTKLALSLAKEFGGELVSCDSRQVYKDLDYLTGKDLPSDGDVPIWMYDVVGFNEQFSVSQYRKLAQKVINDIESRGELPILVGGTGLYLKALTQPLSHIHIPPNTLLREKFMNAPLETLQKEVKRIDVNRWDTMNESDRNNPRRLIRALEIAIWRQDHPEPQEVGHDVDALWVGLRAPMDILFQHIFARVAARWEGAVHEVQQLARQPSVPILGLSPIQNFLQGKCSKSDAIEVWVREEVQYAKRQLTWFKKQPDIHWFDIATRNYQELITILVSSWYTKRDDIKN